MITATLTRLYHMLIPLAVRRRLRLTRFTASRRARLALFRRTGGRVATGPFAGLLLGSATPDDCFGPELVGSYESETHAWLEREIGRDWAIAVNVGSHCGFYSTGLALRLPRATMYAFEMSDGLRVETRVSAARNGVEQRVRALGTATPAVLAALPVPVESGALVVCDCEGCERELLDPVLVPWLVRSALLVELHDFAAPGATDLLRARFSSTHEIAIVEQQPRDPHVWAARAGVSPHDAALLVEERRVWGEGSHRGRWMLASPRSRD